MLNLDGDENKMAWRQASAAAAQAEMANGMAASRKSKQRKYLHMGGVASVKAAAGTNNAAMWNMSLMTAKNVYWG